MPTWGEILEELLRTAPENGGAPDLDGVRRRYLARLQKLTKRDTILYTTDWMSTNQPGTSIVLEDMQAMMEVCKGLDGPGLDVILHSPGGSPDAAASIVRYLRRKFDHIRVFVPLAAMSAATMWALASDEIWMGKHSQLGPIDPQMVSAGGQYPARAILDQFDRAKIELEENPAALAAWLPILQQYGPSLLEECENAEGLARRLVKEWLRAYMFKDRADRALAANRVARYFGDYERHQSHGLGITREDARARGVRIRDLEDDQDLQDAVLSVHHAAIHAFNGPAVKIVENHLGRAYVKMAQVSFAIPNQPGGPQPPPS